MRLGIIAALPDEARTLAVVNDSRPAAHGHLIDVCGVGMSNAGAAAERLIAAGVDGLLSWGTAGALDPNYAAGKLVIYESVLDDAGLRYDCDESWSRALRDTLADLQPIAARGYTATHALTSAAGKIRIREETGCDAIDMESAAIAASAEAVGIPYAVLRVIVDPANFEIPRSALCGLDDDGHTHVLPVAKALLRRPQELPRLLQLGRWYHHALHRLRLATLALHPDFGTV